MKDTSPEALVHQALMRCRSTHIFWNICEDCVVALIRRERAVCARISRSYGSYGSVAHTIADHILARNKPPKAKP